VANGVDPSMDALRRAFWRYEQALTTNDVPALEAAFTSGEQTLRAEGVKVLVGSEHIGEYRRSRVPPPMRRVDRLHLRELGEGRVLAVAEAVRDDGGQGVQTQFWHLIDGHWRIDAAHVAMAPAPLSDPVDDEVTWRAGSRPLRAATSGPLADVRLAVKDLFDVAGQRVGAGVPAWLAQAPIATADAPALARLLDAGAELTGIAQTDELAFALSGTNVHYGTPRNTAVPGAIPGGSSSGPAAAVAAGMAELGLGTDTAGSIRVPASYCGIYGLRPTHGAIPSQGVLPLAPSFDTIGLLARSGAVLGAAANVLLPPAAVTRLSTVVVVEDLMAGLAPDLALGFAAAIEALIGRRGMRLHTLADLGDIDAWLTAFRTIQTAEAWRAHGDFVQAHPHALSAPVLARFRAGEQVSAAAEASAREVARWATATLEALLPPDVVLALPAASSVAPGLNIDADELEVTRAATLRLTCISSLTGRPTLVIPSIRVGPHPVGLSLMGAAGTDRSLLTLLESGVVEP
jgi:amidase